MIIAIIVIAVLLLLAIFFVVGFNRLRSQNVAVDEALGGIDVQLQRRAELIPNLVRTVQGYTEHERGVLESVTAARTRVQEATKGGSVRERAAAEAQLDQAIVGVMAVAEAYPDLKASANFLDLQKQLADTESQLAFSRQFYNDAAARLNTSVATIPWNLFTGVAGVSKREFYEAPEGSSAPPVVEF